VPIFAKTGSACSGRRASRPSPTAWLAEGLLPYLPAATETALFDVIDGHSAPGSRVAFEFMRDQHT
jgi:O-methyltransferase involved in polyketide biosynthesis